MRHLNRLKKLNRNKSHRNALLQNLANSLFDHERIKTTNPKAMELRRVADRLITLAKRKDLHAMRLAFSFLRNKEVVRKLFTDIGDRYAAINGGYTRVLKIGNRKGDNAAMAIIELTMRKEKEKEGEKAKAATPPKTASKPEKKETKTKAPAKKKAAAEEPKVKKEKTAKKEKKEAAPDATAAPKEKKPRKKKVAAEAAVPEQEPQEEEKS